MTRIDELQSRITRALDRIAQGVERWDTAEATFPLGPAEPEPDAFSAMADPAPEPEPRHSEPSESPDSDEIDRLREALEDEKLANAQLTERVRALRERVGNESAELREQVEAQREGMARLDAELQRLRQANEALRRSNDALREANARGVSEPHLINKAMLAELEALRAARSVEAAEVRLVYDALQPLLGEAEQNAPRQEEEDAQ